MTDRQEKQTELPFARAEQLAIVRKAVLAAYGQAAKTRVSARIQKAVLRVLDDHGAPGRPCWLSYETIAAEAPCGVRTAKRAIDALRAQSLICTERRMTPAGVCCNHYTIVWSELALRQTAADQSAANADQSAANADQSAANDQPKCRHGTQNGMKRNETFPGPDPEAGPLPKNFANQTTAIRNPQSQIPNPKSPIPNLPELVEASARPVAPLPAGDLQYGVFAAITIKQLRGAGSMIGWFRKQLSAPRPATGPTEADLLLVLAASIWAVDLPAERIHRNRVAVFVATVSRGRWQRVLPKLPEARRRLAVLLQRYGRHDLLEGPAWPPAKAKARAQ